jgi:hypothetical protein
MIAYQQHGLLQTESKRKMSEAAEALLRAHYDLIDPNGMKFRRLSNGEFLVKTPAATFRVVVSTKIG